MTQPTSADRQTYAPTPGNNSPTVNAHNTFGTAQNGGFSAFKPQTNTFFGNNQFGYASQGGFNSAGTGQQSVFGGMIASISPNDGQTSESVHKSLIPTKSMLES